MPFIKGHKGYTPTLSAAHKRNIGLANIGKGGMKGDKNPNWTGGKPKCIDCGKQLTHYHRKRCKECHYRFIRKEHNPNWQGGLTPINEKIRHSLEYKNWRNKVYKRDNWTCQMCKEKNDKNGVRKKINAHHIKSFSRYPKLRFVVENGITLCEECHYQTTSYGIKLNNKRILKKRVNSENLLTSNVEDNSEPSQRI